jgi:hypothetical protein
VFEQILRNSMEARCLNTFVVRNAAGQLCAISHFISNGHHALYLKGTNTDRNSGSMHLLMDHAITFYRERKVKLFDFGGGQNESLARFYSGFGGVQLNYKIYRVNNLPRPLKWLKR